MHRFDCLVLNMTTISKLIFFIIYYLLSVCSCENSTRPHIIFIMADDLGFNDVGFHGSSEIPTPNIDALAYSGVILNNYYVNPICTPSRSALMTGKHPIHTGMQHTVLYGAEPRGLPLSEKLLPQHMKELGYVTRIVGKWHLGSWKLEYTPTYRGFDSHLGFWTGHHDYNDHTAMETPGWGLDMRRNTEVAWDLHGQYSTDVFTKEAVQIISSHNASEPLFLYLAHAAVHSGNPYNPLAAPDDLVAGFSHIKTYPRQRFAGMLSMLDESVGKVVDALGKAGMLENSVIVFSTDNGGPAEGFNLNAASNWPLRGVKNTLWEGGIRGTGVLWSPLISKPKRIAVQMMHVTDWLPTLYAAAGGNSSALDVDGYDIWKALSENTMSLRNEILHNIDDIYGNSALTSGQWKIVKGSTYGGAWDSWYGPSGRTGTYNTSSVTSSLAGKSLSKIKRAATATEMLSLRKKAEVVCAGTNSEKKTPCKPLLAPCLFNVEKDPCEQRNLADLYPEVLEQLEVNLSKWNSTAVPPGNLPLDPKGNPKYWDHTWTNFGDYTTNSVNMVI